jgi:beta-galactosidase
MKKVFVYKGIAFRLACQLIITLSLFFGCSNQERNQAGGTRPETVADATYFFDQEEVTKIQFDLSEQLMLPMEHALQSASFNRDGNSMHYDTLSFYINNRPVFLHSGEMHYFRIPESQWEDYIIKARNGGLNCISTCVYWGIHEPRNNVWNFSGRYDVARFIELCRKHEMLVILRIGPVINAETRNGGLPQWVRERLPGQYNNQLYPSPQWYLDEVRDWYEQLATQVKMHFPSYGGNVIKIQLDNETNCSWVWGRKETQKDAQVTADQYLKMAMEAGFEGPFSGTYWEPGFTVRPTGTLPVTGAYPIMAWSYDSYPVISHLRMHDARGHYHGFPPESYDKYPVFCAENQGGAGYYTVTPDDFPAGYNFIDIAGGVNATNYYMYAGGTNPQRYPGPWFDQFTGRSIVHPDITKMSYDLMTPLGEFQQTRGTYHPVRRLGLFLESYGGWLQRSRYMGQPGSATIMGKENQAGFRTTGSSGFIFVNSYLLPNDQRKTRASFEIVLKESRLEFPLYTDLVLYRNKPQIIPVRMDIDGVHFRYTTASPLTRFDGFAGRHLVFYSNGTNKAEYYLQNIDKSEVASYHSAVMHEADSGLVFVVDPSDENNIIVITREGTSPVIIKTFTEQQSLQTYRIKNLDSCLVLTDVVPIDFNNGKLRYEYDESNGKRAALSLYPTPGFSPQEKITRQWQESALKLRNSSMKLAYMSEKPGEYIVEIDPKEIPADAKEIYLNTTELDHSRGVELAVDGMMVADSYFRFSGDTSFTGWSFGLKRFLRSNSQQWVAEKQPDRNAYILYNKFSGKALYSSGTAVSMSSPGKLPDKTYMWDLVGSEESLSRVRSLETGMFLTAEGETVMMKHETEMPGQLWNISPSDECYVTIRNQESNTFLDLDEEIVKVNTPPSKLNVNISSYAFTKSMEHFSVSYEYGDYVKPVSFSFLKEGKAEIKLP